MSLSQSDLRDMIANTVSSLGYELLGVEYLARNKNSLLRVYIDSEQGVTLNDCSIVSEQLSAVLDVEDPIKGRYTLEISSPGLDRPLFEKAHYERFIGREARIKTDMAYQGRRNFRGVLIAVNDECVEIEVDRQTFSLPLENIQQARLVPEDI